MLLTRTHQTTSVIMSTVNIDKIAPEDLLMTIPDSNSGKPRVLVLTGKHAGKRAVLGDRKVQAASNLEEKVKEITVDGMAKWEKYLRKEWKKSKKDSDGKPLPFPSPEKESTGAWYNPMSYIRSSSTDDSPAAPPNTAEPEAPAAPAAPAAAPVVTSTSSFDANTASKKDLIDEAKTMGVPVPNKASTEKDVKKLRWRVDIAKKLLAFKDTSIGMMYRAAEVSKQEGGDRFAYILSGTIVLCLGKKEEKFCNMISIDPRQKYGIFESYSSVTGAGSGKKFTEQTASFFIQKEARLTYVVHDLDKKQKQTVWRELFKGDKPNRGVDKWIAVANGKLKFKVVAPEAPAAAATPAAAAEAAAPAAAASGFTVGEVVTVLNSTGPNAGKPKKKKFKIIEFAAGGKVGVQSVLDVATGRMGTKKIKVAPNQLVKLDSEAAAEEPAAKTESKPEEGGGGAGGLLSGFAKGLVGAAAAVGNTVVDVAGKAAQNGLSVATGGLVPAAKAVTKKNNLVEIKAYAKSIGVEVSDVKGNKRHKAPWLKAIEKKLEEKQAGGAAAAAAPPSPDQAAAALEAATGGGESKSNSAGYGIGDKVIIAKKDGTAAAWVYQITGVNADGTYKVKQVKKDGGLGKRGSDAATVLRPAASNVVAEYLQDDFLHLEHYKGEQEWEMEGMHEGMIDE